MGVGGIGNTNYIPAHLSREAFYCLLFTTAVYTLQLHRQITYTTSFFFFFGFLADFVSATSAFVITCNKHTILRAH